MLQGRRVLTIYIPNHLVIAAHLEGGRILKHIAVDGIESGGVIEAHRRHQVCQLRAPVRFVPVLQKLREIDIGWLLSGVLQQSRICARHERTRFVKSLEQHDKLAILGHGVIHHPSLICELRPDQARAHVFRSTHITVIAVHVGRLVRAGTRSVWDQPFINRTPARRNCITRCCRM